MGEPSVGRPRSEEASRAILAAAIDLIAERRSLEGVSMDAIATRSGVSKATIYRRWSSKEELVAAAVDSIKAPPEHGLPHESVRDDLVRLGRGLRSDLSDKEHAVLRCVMNEAPRNPALQEHHDRLMDRRREFGRSVFRHWVEQGVLRPDLDVALAAAMFINTILMIQVYDHYPELKSPGLVERVADQLLAGIEIEADE